MKLNNLLTGLLLCLTSVTAFADNDNDASSLAALADKSPSNTALNLKAGHALYEAGKNAQAKTYFSRGGNEAQPWIALIEFEDYRFDQALERAEKYLASKHNAESSEHKLATELKKRVEIAKTMLDRVEKVQVIDSITVNRADFFKAYGISPSTGRVANRKALPQGMIAADPTTVYVSEKGDRMMWGQTDGNGKVHIVETSHLADGTWESPSAIGDNLQLGGNANFPFLLSDGITLYYASDGEGSLGGYDIYVTRNDGDRYLNPQNIGMPYNSPMDDYLLAIDDATGAGWWATDRNLIPDSVTIYMFVPQELRDNYPVDGTPDLINRARITSVAATQIAGKDYSAVKKAVKAVSSDNNTSTETIMFALSLPDGRVIRNLDQFTEPEARELMSELLDERAEMEKRRRNLLELRKAYANGDRSAEEQIRAEETELPELEKQLLHLQNDVIKAEIRN